MAVSAHAAPPPDANGRFSDWFRSLVVPQSRTPCCDVADCRMVESRWNSQTRHYEAKVVREMFGSALRNHIRGEDKAGRQEVWNTWIRSWVQNFGETAEVWIEIPDDRINDVDNPTGHVVLCWTPFPNGSNGVFCFVPFRAARNHDKREPEYS